jgi:hypothetical protein
MRNRCDIETMPDGALALTSDVIGNCPLELVRHLMPDIHAVTLETAETVLLHGNWSFAPGQRWRLELTDDCSWPELIYGALRFIHGQIHCLDDRLVLDAACVTFSGHGLLLVGSGKSHWAANLGNFGAEVVSDDTTILTFGFGETLAWGRPSSVISSRTGAVFVAPQPTSLRNTKVTRIVHVEGGYRLGVIQEPNQTDSFSWLLQAGMGRILNTRAWPTGLADMYVGDFVGAHKAASLVQGMSTIPMLSAVGDVAPISLLSHLKKGHPSCG